MPTYKVIYKVVTESIITSKANAICMTEVLRQIDAQEDTIVDVSHGDIIQRSIISINECPDLAAHAAIEQGTK